MPPIRSLPNIKPVKTERTHEENQERAYIAASRRSDRSLEARVESARRASEIHKRRTGRSLRVTEQDVVNEEMYEEEDDDLPMQYRRLTAHLNTNSSDFNRRLAAYLSNHVQMRTALDQAISNSYSQPQQPGQNQLFQASNGLTQQKWLPGQNPQYPSSLSQHMAAHKIPSPSDYHQMSYTQQNMRPSLPTKHSHDSSKQYNSKQEDLISSPSSQGRRTSAASQHDNLPRVSSIDTPSLSGTDGPVSVSSAPPQICKDDPSFTNPIFPQQAHSPHPDSAISPLTTELPRETQMFFGSGYGPYGQSVNNGYPFFAYDQPCKPSFNVPYLDGMNQTLAPGALDSESLQWSGSNNAYHSGPAPGYPADMGAFFSHDPFVSSNFGLDGVDYGGQLTPGANEWSSFIDTASWDET